MPRDEGDGRETARRSLQLMWGPAPEPTRGPKPGLSIDAIVRAAIELADAEGLVALSMRRIAGALGVGAMSLYRYVPGKGELVDLMVDAVYAEGFAGAEGPLADQRIDTAAKAGDWRDRLEFMGRQEWAMYLRHPWMLQIAQGRPMLGPNSMRTTDVALHAVDDLGLTEHEMLAAVVTVSAFVSGLARSVIEATQAAERTGISDEEWWEIQGEYVGPSIVAGELPMLTKVGEAGVFTSDFDNLGFGLRRVLDGLSVLIESRRGDPAKPLPGAPAP